MLLLLTFFVCQTVLFAQSPAALTNFLQNKTLSHAAISLKAVDLTTGKTIVSHNAQAALIPASNMKIITTATALDVLGARFCFETPLLYDGNIENATLVGNLYIKGNGDPTLGSEYTGNDKTLFLQTWLQALREAGIERIKGDIIVLDQLYGYEGVSPKWLWEDMGNSYAAGVYGISVFDNMCRIYVRSSAPGTSPEILYTEPRMDLSLTNEIKASESSSDESAVFGLPFSDKRRLYGTIPSNRASFAVLSDIPDPGLYLARYFHSYLQTNGIEMDGLATTYRLNPKLPQNGEKIALVTSPNLARIVRTVNMKSNNHYAEHLYKWLTVIKALDIPAYWKAKGLDTDALFMLDGSGLSPSNAVSAGFILDVLTYMDKKYGREGAFFKSLPLAGKEGTVTSLLKHTALEGKAHLKSGSFTHVQSYSGYVEKENKLYAISLIINNYTGTHAELRKNIEQLFIGLF
jgi:D-alanyl-D-alanine carboxypeptidase/D-alanyl-D-alanine-endopeptidase (penicillin-binding protein 4)